MVSINFEGAKQFYASQPDKAAAQAAFDTLVNCPPRIRGAGGKRSRKRQGRVRPHSGCGKEDPV